MTKTISAGTLSPLFKNEITGNQLLDFNFLPFQCEMTARCRYWATGQQRQRINCQDQVCNAVGIKHQQKLCTRFINDKKGISRNSSNNVSIWEKSVATSIPLVEYGVEIDWSLDFYMIDDFQGARIWVFLGCLTDIIWKSLPPKNAPSTSTTGTAASNYPLVVFQ
jgi:hypothetical protein